MAWTFATVWEAIAASQPDTPALVHGERVITWSEFDRRADALAGHLIAAGLGHQAKVAGYLYNGPEYLEAYFAAFKGGFAPVNTNYRYGPDEVTYLFDNADAEAVVFHAGFTGLIEKIRGRLPKVKAWIAVAEPGHPVPAWAADYDAIVARPVATRPVRAPWGVSGDDLLLLYTGGTTGMPKGVMWRQDDLFQVIGAGGNAALGIPPATSIPELIDRIQGPEHLRATMIVCAPLMHGTGQFSAFIAFNGGGT
ncbi:MAG: AMP-binding protein, partial [Phenylobacterium sp.]|nr:AMP-binding protein [Phenylobacterium sp.]